MKDVAADITAFLESVVSLSLTRGTNLFVGGLPEAGLASDGAVVADKCVAVILTGGGSPEPFIGQGKKALLSPRCQVVIRGNPNQFADGQTLAFGVWEALNQNTLTGYVSTIVRESAPFWGGLDQSDHPLWSLNVEATYLNSPA